MKALTLSSCLLALGIVASAHAQLSVRPMVSIPAGTYTIDVDNYPGSGTYANAPHMTDASSQSVTFTYGVQLQWDGKYGVPPPTLNFAYNYYDYVSASAQRTWNTAHPGSTSAHAKIRQLPADAELDNRPPPADEQAISYDHTDAGDQYPLDIHKVTDAISIPWQYVAETNQCLAQIDSFEAVTSTSTATFSSAINIDDGASAVSAESYTKFICTQYPPQ